MMVALCCVWWKKRAIIRVSSSGGCSEGRTSRRVPCGVSPRAVLVTNHASVSNRVASLQWCGYATFYHWPAAGARLPGQVAEHSVHISLGADDQRRALVKGLGLLVQDARLAVGGGPAALLGQKGHRVGLVHEPQLAARVLGRRRIQEDTAPQRRAVEVGHQRADVAAGVRPGLLALAPGEVLLHALGEGRIVRFVHRINLAVLRHADV